MSGENIGLSIDDLLGIAEAEVTDLERLGLGGLPDALDEYGITSQREVDAVVKTVAKTSFRQLVSFVHADKSRKSEDDDAHFKSITRAMQNITADPAAAVAEFQLHSNRENEARPALSAINPLHEMHRRIIALRNEKTELLYGASYAQLFGLTPEFDKVVLDITMQHAYTMPDKAKTLYMYNEDDREFREQVNITHTAQILVTSESLKIIGFKAVPMEDANEEDVAEHVSEHRKHYQRAEDDFTIALDSVRIIGGYKTPNASPDDLTVQPHDISTLISAPSGQIDALFLIDSTPEKYPALDKVGICMPRDSHNDRQNELIVARRSPGSGELLVGSLGAYITRT